MNVTGSYTKAEPKRRRQIIEFELELVTFPKHISPEKKQYFDELTTSLAEVQLAKHPPKKILVQETY